MTLTEIENVLQSLSARHQNLNEELLITLLTAGGWEEKYIKDACALFKTMPKKVLPSPVAEEKPIQYSVNNNHPNENMGDIVASPQSVNTNTSIKSEEQNIYTQPSAVPVLTEQIHITKSENTVNVATIKTGEMVYYNGNGEEEVLLPSIPDDQVVENGHNLTKENQDKIFLVGDITNKTSTPIEEGQVLPESLIVPPPQKKEPNALPPENLPVKPFDSSPHFWSFAKYKEVFDAKAHIDEASIVASQSVQKNSKLVSTVEDVQKKDIVIKSSTRTKRTGFDAEDEGLIFLTATTLLIILLLLAYMYSNGRI